MNAAAIIPARYASTRFPGKALADLKGKPLIQWVWEAVSGSELFSDIVIATDSALIRDAAKRFGARVTLTREDHPSGSDRVAEVAKGLDVQIVVNAQGDEPLIDKAALSSLLKTFDDPQVRMASLMTRIRDPQQLDDPNTVKVVVDQRSDALYFSRSPIPCNRDRASWNGYWRHIGVYAYRKQTLLEFVALPQGELEQVEKLEQLRALEHGIPIRMVETSYQGIGIDTPEDLLKVQLLLAT